MSNYPAKGIIGAILFSLVVAVPAIAQKRTVFQPKIQDGAIINYYDYKLRLKQIQDRLKNNEVEQPERSLLQKQLDSLHSSGKSIYSSYTQSKESALKQFRGIAGEISFSFNGQEYDAIIIDPGRQRISMYWLSDKNVPFKSLSSVKQVLDKTDDKIIMLTNGGMYLEGNIPQGLFMSNGKEFRPVDTSSNKYGNFYLKPNGVLYIDSAAAFIVTTEIFMRMSPAKRSNILYATQSGPMLVVNDEINKQFTHQSKNLNLRSGVGKLPNNNIVFIISRSDKTNFHDFAVIFKDIFGCKNALYLDGAISKMYLPGIRPTDLGGNFGAIICVANK